MTAQRGMFISLDGVDGTGKSTQCGLLAEWMRSLDRNVVVCHDPGGTELGQQLRTILLHNRGQMALATEAMLFMASRAQLVSEVIAPALAAGSDVVSDRFLLANVAYQGHAGGLNPLQVWQAGLLATGGVEPDVTFVLDLPIEMSMHRRKKTADRIERRGTEYSAAVRAGFIAEAARLPNKIQVIDASSDVPSVLEHIRRVVFDRLGELW